MSQSFDPDLSQSPSKANEDKTQKEALDQSDKIADLEKQLREERETHQNEMMALQETFSNRRTVDSSGAENDEIQSKIRQQETVIENMSAKNKELEEELKSLKNESTLSESWKDEVVNVKVIVQIKCIKFPNPNTF